MKKENLRFRTHSQPRPKKRIVVKANTGRYIRCIAVTEPLAETKQGKQKKRDQETLNFIAHGLLTPCEGPFGHRFPMSSFMPESIVPSMDDPLRLSMGIGIMGIGGAAAIIKSK